MDNLKEFKDLIKRYNSITYDEIESITCNDMLSHEKIARELTGFGSLHTCSLCIAIYEYPKHLAHRLNNIKILCTNCTWVKQTGVKCYQGDNKLTHYKIKDNRGMDLLKAFKARSKYMEYVLKK